MLNSKRLNNIILERNIAQSICPASKFHRKKINSMLALRTHTKKDQTSVAMMLTWPAHVLTNSSHVLVRFQFTDRDTPQQNSSGVAILVSLQECQECEFFQHITVHRKPPLESHRSKLGLRSTSPNAISYYYHFVGHCGAFCGLKWRIWRAKIYFSPLK